MQSADNSVDIMCITGAQLPTGDALPAAFLELKQLLDNESTLSEKKSHVLRQQQARIAVLEE